MRDVFINVPFDTSYLPLFDAICFSIVVCGYRARCSLEIEDSSQTRIEKLYRLIEACQLSVHDISRAETNKRGARDRYNMPFELGLFLGAKRFGNSFHSEKNCLVLSTGPRVYKEYFSDLSGHDIKAHSNSPPLVIQRIRNWLKARDEAIELTAPDILSLYALFRQDLRKFLKRKKMAEDALTFVDRIQNIVDWLANAKDPKSAVHRRFVEASFRLNQMATMGILDSYLSGSPARRALAALRLRLGGR